MERHKAKVLFKPEWLNMVAQGTSEAPAVGESPRLLYITKLVETVTVKEEFSSLNDGESKKKIERSDAGYVLNDG